MYDKEGVYDNEISPLMQKIVEICKREKMPMAAQFYIKQEREDSEWEGQPLFCTTVLPFGEKNDSEGHERIYEVAETMKYGKEGPPFVAAYTIRAVK